MDTFFEIVKSLIPFIVSLVAIYLKIIVDRRNDKKYARKNLLSIIIDEMGDINEYCVSIDEQLEYLKKGEVVYINVKVPAILIECLKVMSKVDHKNTSIYYKYQAFIEIVIDDHKNLVGLLNTAANKDLKNSPVFMKAIKSQILSFKNDLLQKFEYEKKLMDILIHNK